MIRDPSIKRRFQVLDRVVAKRPVERMLFTLCSLTLVLAARDARAQTLNRSTPFPIRCDETKNASQAATERAVSPAGSIRSYPESAAAIRKQGDWFVDAQGRYLLFRGVNLGSRSKLAPYLPVLPLRDTVPPRADSDSVVQELRSVRPRLHELQELGFNFVRLLVMWKAIEPSIGVDSAGVHYLHMLRLVTDALYCERIFVVLDFHQDIASEAYGGDGFPDWAIAKDAEHPATPRPPPNVAWGLRYYETGPGGKLILGFFKTKISPVIHTAVRNTLQEFWHDSLRNDSIGLIGFHVRSHLVNAIATAARFFRGQPGVLGYEALNEPHPVGLGKREFEEKVLPAFYHEVDSAVGLADTSAFLLVEPRMDWTTFEARDPEPILQAIDIPRALHLTQIPTTYLDLTRVEKANSRLVFAFHFYDPWLALGLPFLGNRSQYWRAAFRVMRGAADSRHLIPFLTEFGCSHSNPQRHSCIDLQYQQVEAQLLNSSYWNYDLYATPDGRDNWNNEDLSLLRPDSTVEDAKIIARPYPIRSAARPSRIFFDARRKVGCILLEGPTVPAPTVVFVPKRIQYPTRFEVESTGDPSAVTWSADDQLLYWNPDPSLGQQLLVIHPPPVSSKRPSRAVRNSLPVECRARTTAHNTF